MRLTKRLYIHEVLDGQRKHGFLYWTVDLFLIALILLNVAAVAVETLPGWSEAYGLRFFALEAFSAIVFTVEYALRLWSCVEDRRHDYSHPLWGRLRYALTPLALIDLAVVVPFFLSFLVPIDLRILRLFRLLRLLKITRYSPALMSLGAVFRAESRSILGAMMLMTIAVLIASTVMYLLEREAQPELFGSIPEAMWWGVVTLTTVGYGDVTPITLLGRVFGALVTVLGIGIFALPTAILAAGFAREIGKHDFVVTVARVAKVPVFSHLEPVTLAEIAALLTPMHAPARYAVVRRGEETEALYFIVQGKVEVDLPHGSVDLGPGEFFGEMSLLEGMDRRNATISTLTDCQFLVLQVPDFHDLVDRLPELKDRIAEMARRRAGEVRFADDKAAGDGETAADAAERKAHSED
ncbi:MAG: cyclic nucleotide-binding domain-containing protein [Inquilinus sp.]|nr:cyclic nucleotide-binding domain-containing protein [Inquilinus sp.]